MVSISSLQFDETLVEGWHLADNHERGRGWMDTPDPQSAQLSMTLTIDWNPPRQLIPVDTITSNLEVLRADRVQKANLQGMTLLEHEVITTANSLSVIRVIEKKPMQPHGMAYYGTITLLNEASGFLIQMWCFEVGITGMRDSFVLNDFMGGGTFDPEKEDWGGWMIDPYGFGKQPLMHNVAELSQYDEQFPDHPLTKLRHYQPRVISSLTFDPNVEFFGKEAPKKSTSWFGKLFGK